LSQLHRNEIHARLRRLPVEFLVALINATSILVIVAAILALVTMVRINNFGGRIATTMTEAALSKIDLPSKDVLANLQNLTEEVRTLIARLGQAVTDTLTKMRGCTSNVGQVQPYLRDGTAAAGDTVGRVPLIRRRPT
jgi:predicted PurR-regulated permease PerM